LCHCFRDEEVGEQHSREFTMLEWYRAHSTLAAIRHDTEELVAAVATAVRGRPEVETGGRIIDVSPNWPVMTVREAMQRFADVIVEGDESADELAKRVRGAGIDIGTATAWDDIFFCAFVSRVEPALRTLSRPVFVEDWPLPLAALAQRRPGRECVAERFEAYVGGVELANAFGELVCPVEQRRRFAGELATRKERGLPLYPMDERFLAALESGMPPSGGIALGVDRLLMLVLGANEIAAVQLFPERDL
jgi:lysyl-tRNA synthetase class 2